MILVTGASGVTGRSVVAALARRGAAVRAFVHRAQSTVDGAREHAVGDLQRADDIAAALRGVRAVYHIAPNVHPAEVAIGRALIDAGRAAGVAHFVFHSVIQPQIAAMPHHWAKLEVEAHLVAAGIDYTILQPAVYMQNLRFQWTDIVARGEYAQPFRAESRLAMVDLDDVGEAAARVLTEPGWRNGTFELVGTPAMDRHAMAAILAAALGRPVRAAVEPLDAWHARTLPLLGAHATDALRAMFAYYDRHGLSAANSRALALILGREPSSFAAFAARTRDASERGREASEGGRSAR